MSEKSGSKKGIRDRLEEAVKEVKLDKFNPITSKYNGIPYVGPQLNIKSNDIDRRLPQLKGKVQVAVIKSDNEEDLKRQEEILQKVAEGSAAIETQRIEFDKLNGRFLIYMEWIEYYYTAPGDN